MKSNIVLWNVLFLVTNRSGSHYYVITAEHTCNNLIKTRIAKLDESRNIIIEIMYLDLRSKNKIKPIS